MRGRSNEKLNSVHNLINNINNNINNNNNFLLQNLGYNNYSTHTVNYENNNTYNNYSNQRILDMSNSINGNLNGSFQDYNYKNKNNQIYCKSPKRYNRQTFIESRNYGSSNNIFGYNNDNDFYDNGFNKSLNGMNSMTNIHNYTNYKTNTMYNNYNNNYSKPSYSINLEDLMIIFYGYNLREINISDDLNDLIKNKKEKIPDVILVKKKYNIYKKIFKLKHNNMEVDDEIKKDKKKMNQKEILIYLISIIK